MATGSLMMGTLKGKLGETVAARRNGKQVLRAYVANVKNPNSQKQQVQRMVQSTAAQAYSAMKKICDHSFEGVQVGQKSMSYFLSKNMDMLRANIAAGVDGTLEGATADFVRKGVNLPVLNKYIVGKGTLPAVNLIDHEDLVIEAAEPASKVYLFESNQSRSSENLVKFIANNSGQVGDWFTFLFLLEENGVMQNGQKVYRFAFVRFVVEYESEDSDAQLVLTPSLTTYGSSPFSWDEVFSVVASNAENVYYFAFDLSVILPNIGEGEGLLTPVAYACIHSRQNVGGSWQRSNAEFVIRDNWDALNITWPDNFFDELATYAGSAEAKGQGDYVLNGGE